jgi:hypothetical protein
MRPFFDACEFPQSTLVEDDHGHHGLRYNCTLSPCCTSATQVVAYDGANEKHRDEDGGDGAKSDLSSGDKSDASPVKTCRDCKQTPSTMAVSIGEAVYTCG